MKGKRIIKNYMENILSDYMINIGNHRNKKTSLIQASLLILPTSASKNIFSSSSPTYWAY